MCGEKERERDRDGGGRVQEGKPIGPIHRECKLHYKNMIGKDMKGDQIKKPFLALGTFYPEILSHELLSLKAILI